MEKLFSSLATIVVALCLLMMLATAEESLSTGPSFPDPHNFEGSIKIMELYEVSTGDNITCRKGNGYILSVSLHEEDGGDFRIYKIMKSGEKELVAYIPGFLVEDMNENGELAYNWKRETKHTFIYGADRPLNEDLDPDFSIRGQVRIWNRNPFPKEGTIHDYFSWRNLLEDPAWRPCE